MFANVSDIDGLLEIQQIDLDVMHLEKQLDELPQRRVILQARTKRKAIEEKASQIAALRKETEKKLTRLKDEDASLEKKEKGVQAAIEAASGDYRNVEARTKELNGIFKRRSTLAEEKEGIDAQLTKIADTEAQVSSALAELDATEQSATESFKQEGTALKAAIHDAGLRRESILADMDADVVAAYHKVSDHIGAVVVGKLDGDRCGVCRATIDGGRLIQIKSEAPLSFCPHCKRLMIIE